MRKFSIWKICRPFGYGPDGNFSGPKSLAVQNFFNALRAGLTNPRDISDSFNETPLRLSWLIARRSRLILIVKRKYREEGILAEALRGP